MLKRQIKKHGNSFVVKIEPTDIVENNLKVGDWVDVSFCNESADIKELISSSKDFVAAMEDRVAMKLLLRDEIKDELMEEVEESIIEKLKKEDMLK